MVGKIGKIKVCGVVGQIGKINLCGGVGSVVRHIGKIKVCGQSGQCGGSNWENQGMWRSGRCGGSNWENHGKWAEWAVWWDIMGQEKYVGRLERYVEELAVWWGKLET